jgi:hypothetical protein
LIGQKDIQIRDIISSTSIQISEANQTISLLRSERHIEDIKQLQADKDKLVSDLTFIQNELQQFSSLTIDEEARLRATLIGIPREQRFTLTIYYAQLGGEPLFARRFASIFKSCGWHAEVKTHGFLRANLKGTAIMVSKDVASGAVAFPVGAVQLSVIFQQAGVPYRFSWLDSIKDAECALVVWARE